MDFRLRLSLLLLLAFTGGAWSKATRDGPTSSPRHQHSPHQHHRHHRQLQRPARALNEFLVPPPVPTKFRGPRGPPQLPTPPPIQHQQKSNDHNQPPPPPLPPPPLSPPPMPHKQHTRNGRYVNQQGGSSNNNGIGYFSKLIDWLNPFVGKEDKIAKDSHVQAASNFPRHQQVAQYAPHQPYTDGDAQPEPPPHPANLQASYSNLAFWMSRKPCNPCNQVPWIPVLRDGFQSNLGQYAPSAGTNHYLPPSPPQEVNVPDFSYLEPTPAPQQNYPIPYPHLYTGMMLPLFKAKPFNDAPVNLHQQPLINYNQPPPNLDQLPPPNINHQLPQNLAASPESNFNHPPPSSFDQNPLSNFNHQPQLNFEQRPPSNFNHPPSPHFDHSPSQNFDQQPPVPNVNYQSPPNPDHPLGSFDSPVYNPSSNSDHPPQNFDDQPPPGFDQHSSNFDYDPSPNFDNPSNYEDQHPTSNFEQHHEPSQIVDVIKEPPSDLQSNKVNSHQEEDNAASRPVFLNSNKTSSILRITPSSETGRFPTNQGFRPGAIVHFQRSPLIDLTVLGESPRTTAPNYQWPNESSNRFRDRPTEQPVTIPPSKGKAISDHHESPTRSASVLDYIVSSADAAFGSGEAEKETRPPTRLQHQSERTVVPLNVTSTSTTTTTTTTASTTQRATTTTPRDQRQQESLIETLVQSYEFYKKNSTGMNETEVGGRVYNDSEDFSASREVIIPNKLDNGKKNKQIIQIIIPYTSQYTPSPFHPTRSVDGHEKKHDYGGESSGIMHKEKSKATIDDDNVEDNVLSEESRRVSVMRNPPDRLLRNNETEGGVAKNRVGNAIDVHRLQKNIDNWTIQEYSKITTSVTNSPNSTYPRWLSSKQIPNEYLLSTTEVEESSEYYDFSNETDVRRGTNKSEETTTRPEYATKVKIVNATYPKKPDPKRRDSERVYVVTPIPNPNSLEDLSSEKDQTRLRQRKPKQSSAPVERAYQVLPQAVNSLAVLSSAPESAAPALWGIMEHEEIATGADQPRWRSELDALPESTSAPVLYAGHSKVSRAR